MKLPHSRILITDCDHDAVEVERAVAADRGFDLALAQCVTEDEVIQAAAGLPGIVVQYAPITARVMDALPELRAIGRYGVGVDTVDVAVASERGIAVCNVPDYGTEDVSDHAIALAVALGRGLRTLDLSARSGAFSLEGAKPLHRFSHRTFGVLGMGRIGLATARKAQGLGYRVIGCDTREDGSGRVPEWMEVVTFEEILAESDVLSLHVPLTERTQHLLDTTAITQMKRSAVVINTCRGGVIDTDALVEAIQDGRLAGAGLDVFEEEPLNAGHPLTALEHVILTPHAAWYSEESYTELKTRAIENVLDVVTGVAPRDLLNPESLAMGTRGGQR